MTSEIPISSKFVAEGNIIQQEIKFKCLGINESDKKCSMSKQYKKKKQTRPKSFETKRKLVAEETKIMSTITGNTVVDRKY